MKTLNEAVEKFIKIKIVGQRSDETIKWYISILGAMTAQLGNDLDVTTITDDMLLDYIVSLRERDMRYADAPQRAAESGGLSKSSIASHIRALKSFWKWAAIQYDMRDPLRSVSIPKRARQKPKAIDHSDFARLFHAINENNCKSPERDRAILALLADSGVRRGGLVSMTIRETDTIRRKARVIEKGDRERFITWAPYVSELIRAWVGVRPHTDHNALFINLNDKQPLQVSAINQILKRLKAKAGVTGRVNPHSFRHGFAKTYLMSGGDLATLAQLMGHSSQAVTSDFYAVFTADELTTMHAKHSPLNHMLKRD